MASQKSALAIQYGVRPEMSRMQLSSCGVISCSIITPAAYSLKNSRVPSGVTRLCEATAESSSIVPSVHHAGSGESGSGDMSINTAARSFSLPNCCI